MTRNDIVGDKSFPEMTLDELAFRRNGHFRDLHEPGNRNAESLKKKDNAAAGLAEAEAEIGRRMKVKVP